MIRLSHCVRVAALGALQRPCRGIASVLVLLAVFGSLLVLFSSPIAEHSPAPALTRITVSSGLMGSGHRNAPAQARQPIDDLIREARHSFKQQLGKRSLTLDQAASRYRERRGRHPPPGFDKWFAAAAQSNAIIVEDFFDRIHHDIEPFWGVEPRHIRNMAHDQPHMVRVRRGNATAVSDNEDVHWRLKTWVAHIQSIAPHLPDLDMPINHMDESRVLVSWEEMAKHVAEAHKKRAFTPLDDATQKFGGVDDVANNTRYDPKWLGGDVHEYWDLMRTACPPDAPGRNVSSIPDFTSVIEYPTSPVSLYTYKGYVRNVTMGRDPCLQPHLRGMHGTFVEAISMSTTRELFPIFGESKLPANNEILIPAAMNLAEDIRKDYNGGDTRGGPWEEKKNLVIWRGAASGARNHEGNWWHNHRHRFVQMMNGTTVSELEAGNVMAAPTFRLLPPVSDPYALPARKQGRLGKWLSTVADVGFNHMLCHPPEFYEEKGVSVKKKTCRHTDTLMSVADSMPFDHLYDYKYMPDVDGTSYSGRYRAFLLSSSMPLKATIYAEWHDDRLTPWVHFVPFDNSYMDLYGIMDYFVEKNHDAEAEEIATNGQAWAQAVLRKEDMRLYTWRLLLEYARVADDNRDKLAFVDDLTRSDLNLKV